MTLCVIYFLFILDANVIDEFEYRLQRTTEHELSCTRVTLTTYEANIVTQANLFVLIESSSTCTLLVPRPYVK